MPSTGVFAFLSEHEETIGKAIGTICVIGGIAWSRISSKRVPKGWTAEYAKGEVAPTVHLPEDPDRETMRRRVELAEQRTEVLTLRWQLTDAEGRLKSALGEVQAKTAAVSHERAMNAELLRSSRSKDLLIEQLRLQIAQLQLALDNSEDVLEVVPADSDWAEDTNPRSKIER